MLRYNCQQLQKLTTVNWLRNLLQFLSSLPSEQVPYPVHREMEEETHCPLAHRNWVELQPKCNIHLTRLNDNTSRLSQKYELLPYSHEGATTPYFWPSFLYRVKVMSTHPGASFTCLMECTCEVQPQALCISEIRNFVLYFHWRLYITMQPCIDRRI